MQRRTRAVVFLVLCFVTNAKAFQPANRIELKSAVDACLQIDDTGRTCEKDGVHISLWDTSKVTDMSHMFYKYYKFNGNVTNWDVSKVNVILDGE